MKLSMLILSLSLLAVMSCCKEASPHPWINSKEPLSEVWRTPIVPDINLNFSISMNPVLFDDVVVFNSELMLNGVNAPVLFLDTATGSILDSWSDYSDGPFAYDKERQQFSENYLFLGGQQSVDCINMQTRQTQWHSMMAENTPNIYVSNGYLYRGIEYGFQGSMNKKAALMRTPLDQNDWDTVFAFSGNSNFSPGFDSMGFGSLPNGNNVVVWKNRSYSSSADKTEIFAYDLTADSLLWRNTDFSEGSGIVPLRIHEGVVYGLLLYNAVAIDLSTGTTKWTQNFSSVHPTLPLDFVEGDIHFEGDNLLIKGQSDELIALDASDGSIVWVVQNSPYGIEDRFTYFEGKLFYSADRLVIVDVLTGEELITEDQVEHLGDIDSRIVIDPSRRVMYMHNGKEALCVKIPNDI